MKKTILLGVVFLLLIQPIALAVEPPQVQKENCEESGGEFVDFKCVCQIGITSMWSRCWIKTPKESCVELKGEVSYKPIVGALGSGFTCMKNSEDITEQARENAVLNKPKLWHKVIAPNSVNPDSIWWDVDKILEKLQLKFTTNKVKKAQLRIKIANERLQEQKEMLEKNKLIYANRAEELGKETIAEVEKDLEEIEDVNAIKDLEERLSKHIEVLNEVLAKAPEQAQFGLQIAINKSSKVLDVMKEKKKIIKEKPIITNS